MVLFIAGGRNTFRQETGGKGLSPFWGLWEQTLCLLSFWAPEMEVVKSKGFSQYREKLQKKNRPKITEYAPCFFVAVLVDLYLECRWEGFHRNLPGCLIIINPDPGKNQYYIFQANTENFEESILPENHSCLGCLLMLLLAIERESLLMKKIVLIIGIILIIAGSLWWLYGLRSGSD